MTGGPENCARADRVMSVRPQELPGLRAAVVAVNPNGKDGSRLS